MMKCIEKMTGLVKEIPQKYYRVVAALVAGMVLAISVGAVSASTVAINVFDNGEVSRIYTIARDADTIMNQLGFEEEDEIKGELSEFVGGVATLMVYRPFMATIVDGESEKQISVTRTTVAQTLESAGITLGIHDQLNVNAEEYATAEPIRITRVSYAEETVEEPIPCEMAKIPTATMTIGTNRVVSSGQNGVKSMKYTVRYENGNVIQKTLVGSTVVQPPVNGVMKVGTAPVIARTGPISELAVPADLKLDGNGIPANYKSVQGGLSAVAYYAEPGSGTASGMRAVPGVVAVDPRVIPYGTKMYIVANDGTVYGYAVAGDTGYSVCNGVIDLDLFMNTINDCYRWGRKNVTVYFL